MFPEDVYWFEFITRSSQKICSHTPAPLELCFFPGFDLNDDDSFCPLERNALKMFYDSAKGNEWTNSSHWTDPYKSHCSWHGVYCNGSNSTIKLELRNNGLSGTLSSSIANLSLIEYLNLADNDIMVGTFMCVYP